MHSSKKNLCTFPEAAEVPADFFQIINVFFSSTTSGGKESSGSC